LIAAFIPLLVAPAATYPFIRVSNRASRHAANLERALSELSEQKLKRKETEERSEGFEDRIDLVSLAGGIGLIEFFHDTRTFKCNAEVSRRLGLAHTYEERSIDLFFAHQPDEIKSLFAQKSAEYAESRDAGAYRFTHPFYLPSGELRYYKVSRNARTREGRTSFLGLSVDVTEEVIAKQEYETVHRNLAAACEFGGIYLIHTNLSNGETDYIIRPTQGESEPLSGDRLLQAVKPKYHQALLAAHNQTGESVEFPLHYPGWSEARWTRDQSVRHWEDSNGDKHAIILSQDIHDQHLKEQALADALDALDQKQQKQTQMFSIIGHELRTPLSSMKMMQDAMGLRSIGEYGANICDSTDAVLNIVDDLRTVINPDKAHQAQAVVDSPFDVLSRTTRSLEGLYEQQGVEVVVSSNQLSHSLSKFNAQALRQKITNLTKNAAIHADADTVWVDLQAQPNGDDKVDLTLIVEDNGKGIPEGLREAVFGAFSRGDTRADGTGLGLYITRELAEKLGGTVEYFESEKGGAGFKVEFTLDLHLDANEQEQVEEAIPVALQGKRILFAEDQKTLQLLTSKLLKDAGAEVVVCDNGKQALDAFRAGEFDIVLTDLMMPEMSGDELIRHIRADGFTGQVVALTAAIIGKETDILLEAGADAVLNKPRDIHDMKRTIAGLAMRDAVA